MSRASEILESIKSVSEDITADLAKDVNLKEWARELTYNIQGDSYKNFGEFRSDVEDFFTEWKPEEYSVRSIQRDWSKFKKFFKKVWKNPTVDNFVAAVAEVVKLGVGQD